MKFELNVIHPFCAYNELKMQVFSKNTTLLLNNQLLVCSHHQAKPKNIKRRNTAATLVGDLGPYNTYYTYITINKSRV
jgi:hypothetical protein